MDFYKVLGVLPNSEDVVIRGAYNALMKKYHPDVFRGDKAEAERKAKELNAAFDVLGDSVKRAAYDLERASRKSKANNSSGPGSTSPNSESNSSANKASSTAPHSDAPSAQSAKSSNIGGWSLSALILFVLGVIGLAMNSTPSPAPSPAANNPPVAAISQPSTGPEVHPVPAKLDWSANSGTPKKYKIGDYVVTLSAGKDNGGAAVAVLDVDLPKTPHLHGEAAAGSEIPSASIQVANLDPKARLPAISFVTYSGGAHCCTSIAIYQPINGQWRHADLGGDGEPLSEIPKDINGDGYLDMILTDDSFLYTFDSYAGSAAPSLIYNLVNGKIVDVSSNRSFSEFFRTEMITDQAGCLMHSNGACAAFVAIASRLGLHDWAWQYMLTNYDKTANWQYPKQCDIDTNGLPCPADHQIASTFPDSLKAFLAHSAYYSEDHSQADDIRPSFGCDHVTSDVLKLVCTTPSLAESDRDLAAAYYASLQNNPLAESLKQDQRNWIRVRNNSAAIVLALQVLYNQRISYLTGVARDIAARASLGMTANTP